jgi:predicted TIM-barrel fold metal-dependent hydrolase
VQVHGLEKDWTGAVSILRKANLKVIIDHMGLERAESGVDQKGFQAVMGLSQDSDVVIKLSAFVRSSRDTRLFEDLDPFVAMVFKHFGVARCVWGSDWPFLGAFPRPDYVEMLAPLARWIPDQSDYRAILWNNPQRLFGFGDERL